MDEFHPLEPDPMSNDETTKIEPILIVKDAPPVASEQPDAVGPIEPESGSAKAAADAVKIEAPVTTAAPAAKTEEPKIEAPKIEATKIEAPKIEAPRIEAKKIELSSEAPLLPPAPQLEPIAVTPKQPKAVSAPLKPPARSTRFALLAASV